MPSKGPRSTVIIVGTMHLEPREYPNYAAWLSHLIEEINPATICAEVSPEQLAGTQACNSKPEQRDVVMPTARKLGIPVVPIQSPTEQGLDWEARFKAVDRELRSREPSRFLLEHLDLLSQQEAELWRRDMKDADCIEHLQLNEYHVFPEARDNVEREFLPQRAALFEEWNQSFLLRIADTIAKNAGRLLLVIVGLWHKYWLCKKLESCDGATVHNIQSFRQSFKAHT